MSTGCICIPHLYPPSPALSRRPRHYPVPGIRPGDNPGHYILRPRYYTIGAGVSGGDVILYRDGLGPGQLHQLPVCSGRVPEHGDDGMELTEKYKQFFQDRHHKMQEALQGRLNYIPVYGQIHEYACALSGAEPRTFYTDPATLIKGTLDTSLKYGLDTPNMSYDVYDIEAEALGMKVWFPASGSPAVDYNRPLIKKPDDIRLLKAPDPRHCARMPFVREVNRLYKEMTGLTPGIKFTGPFSLACIVRAYSNR